MRNKKPTKGSGFTSWINNIDAHHRLGLSILVAVIAYFVFKSRLTHAMQIMATWLAYTVVYLLLSWFTILTSHPAEVKHIAHRQDSSRTVIFIFVIAASLASLFAVIILLQSASELSKTEQLQHIIISIACVAASWWLLHTIFTLRYAHYYYCDVSKDTSGKYEDPGGLIFPQEKKPDYLDFTYFSFVIGMTFQVSDVQITSKVIRHLVWIHGMISFAFNTIIVALSINIISGLLK